MSGDNAHGDSAPAGRGEGSAQLPSDELPFRDVAGMLPIPCWISDSAGELIWVNDAWTALTGLDIADIRGGAIESIHDPLVVNAVGKRWQEILARGQPDQMVFPIRARDGSFKPYLTRVVPMRGKDGVIDRWYGAHTDLTEIPMATEGMLRENRALADQVGEAFARARESETMRQRFWDASRDLLAVIPASTGIPSLMNAEAWTRTLGYSAEELATMRLISLVHPEDLKNSMAQRSVLASGQSIYGFENRYRTATGGWVWLSWNITREGDINYCIARDVTEEKESRARLAASERQLRLMIQSVSDYALFMLTPEGLVATWNPGAERIKGYAAEEIIGKPIYVFYSDADQAAGVPQRAIATAAAEGRYEAEGWRIRKDGTRFWASVVIDAIRDEAGALIGFAKITRDFTERRNAELALRQAQDQLAHAQKMEAIGQLTGGVAHDFNNLLAVIAGGVKLLRRAPDRAEAILESMQDAVDRGARLTTQLLGFARKQDGAPEVIRPAEVIRSMRELLRRSIGEDIEIDIVAPDTSWTVQVDPGQLELVVLNLVVNARDAMPGGGALRIEINNVRNQLGDDMVRITTHDTGTGMAPEVMDRAFEPFFTTKDFGKGSGLGLAQVYGFAQQAGGRAWLENNAEGGLAVHFELPRSTGVASAKPKESPRAKAQPPTIGGRSVLLVEDDASVADMIHQLISQAGFACRHAVSAMDALMALESEKFDVVFSDIVMPGGMNGVELARTIRTRWPSLPVVLATGYSAKADLNPGEFLVFQKPYDADRLIAALWDSSMERAE